MRPILGTAILVVLALLAWWWARVADPERARPSKGEGSGEPITAASAAVEDAGVSEPAPEAPPAAPAQLADVTIRVIDEAGAPIPGARVEVRRDDDADVTAAAVTDGLGHATVPFTSDDVLFIGARGFMRSHVENLPDVGIANVVLRRGYDIAGVVVDAGGKGIDGAALELEEPSLPERATRVTGPAGRFAFEDVCDQEMWLVAQADGYAAGGGTVAPGDTDIRIVLLRTVSASGVVVFPDGSPAAGAQVGGMLSSADGRFTLDNVTPGRFELGASLEAEDRRWIAKSVVEVAADGKHEPIKLVLAPLPRSWINVRVLERDGSPVSGVPVGSPQSDGEAIFPRTNADGRVVCVFDVAPGTKTAVWVVETRDDGLLPGRAVAVTGGRDGPEVVLEPRDQLLVTVVARGPDGSPLPPDTRARILAYGNHVVRRDRDAVVVAVDPLVREITLTVEAPGYLSRYVQTPLPPDGRLEVRLRGVTGAISCRLVDEAGAPVLDGFVLASVRGFGSAGTGEPEPDGAYRIGDVPVGPAIVTAGRNRDLPLARGEVDVRAGEVTDLGTLVFRSPRALCGRVTDMTGRPVGGARLYAVEGDAEAEAFSRSDGSFRILLPPWFDDFALATKPGYGSVHRRVVEPFDLVLSSEGKVRLEVRMPPRGGGSRGWSMAARDPSTGFQWRHVEWKRIEGTTYLVSGLPPGRVVLVVDTLPKDGETEVVVVAGEIVPAVIEVPE